MVVENWLPVVGYEGLYEVSDQGRVRSLSRVVEQRLVGGSQPTVEFHTTDGKKRYERVAHLVAAAFLDGKPFEHANGLHFDNRLSNLRVVQPRRPRYFPLAGKPQSGTETHQPDSRRSEIPPDAAKTQRSHRG